MKKKQLAKLKKQFRPSFETARKQLFDAMITQAQKKYQLDISISIKGGNKDEMAIEFLGETNRDSIITVPLDENFNTVVKRIQRQEKGLLERFSDNLVEEVANYWLAEPATSKTEVVDEIPVVEETVEPATTVEEQTTDSGALAAFKEKISSFPKFFVTETGENLLIFEKTAKEDRQLASVSLTEVGTFAIEPALERKYKLKLDVIPVIEAFAAIAINER